jgi:hypothetical protein
MSPGFQALPREDFAEFSISNPDEAIPKNVVYIIDVKLLVGMCDRTFWVSWRGLTVLSCILCIFLVEH